MIRAAGRVDGRGKVEVLIKNEDVWRTGLATARDRLCLFLVDASSSSSSGGGGGGGSSSSKPTFPVLRFSNICALAFLKFLPQSTTKLFQTKYNKTLRAISCQLITHSLTVFHFCFPQIVQAYDSNFQSSHILRFGSICHCGV